MKTATLVVLLVSLLSLIISFVSAQPISPQPAPLSPIPPLPPGTIFPPGEVVNINPQPLVPPFGSGGGIYRGNNLQGVTPLEYWSLYWVSNTTWSIAVFGRPDINSVWNQTRSFNITLPCTAAAPDGTTSWSTYTMPFLVFNSGTNSATILYGVRCTGGVINNRPGRFQVLQQTNNGASLNTIQTLTESITNQQWNYWPGFITGDQLGDQVFITGRGADSNSRTIAFVRNVVTGQYSPLGDPAARFVIGIDSDGGASFTSQGNVFYYRVGNQIRNWDSNVNQVTDVYNTAFESQSVISSFVISNNGRFAIITTVPYYNPGLGPYALVILETTQPYNFTTHYRIELGQISSSTANQTDVIFGFLCNPGQTVIESFTITVPYLNNPSVMYAFKRRVDITPIPQFTLAESTMFLVNLSSYGSAPRLFGKMTGGVKTISPIPGSVLIGAPMYSTTFGGQPGLIAELVHPDICPLVIPVPPLTDSFPYIIAPNIPDIVIPSSNNAYTRYAINSFTTASGEGIAAVARTNAANQYFATITLKKSNSEYVQRLPPMLMGPVVNYLPNNTEQYTIDKSSIQMSLDNNLVVLGVPMSDQPFYVFQFNAILNRYVERQQLPGVNVTQYQLLRDGRSILMTRSTGDVVHYRFTSLNTDDPTAIFYQIDEFPLLVPPYYITQDLWPIPYVPPSVQMAVDAYGTVLALNYYAGNIFIYRADPVTGIFSYNYTIPTVFQQIRQTRFTASGNMLVIIGTNVSVSATPNLYTMTYNQTSDVWSTPIYSTLNTTQTNNAYGITLSDYGKFMTLQKTQLYDTLTVFSGYNTSWVGHWNFIGTYQDPPWIPEPSVATTTTSRGVFNMNSFTSNCTEIVTGITSLYPAGGATPPSNNLIHGQIGIFNMTEHSEREGGCSILPPPLTPYPPAVVPPGVIPVAPITPPPVVPSLPPIIPPIQSIPPQKNGNQLLPNYVPSAGINVPDENDLLVNSPGYQANRRLEQALVIVGVIFFVGCVIAAAVFGVRYYIRSINDGISSESGMLSSKKK